MGTNPSERITMLKKYSLKDYNFRLIFYVIILNVIGILLIGSASPSVQGKQFFGMISGLTIMVVTSFINYNWILKFSWVMYAFNLLLLASIFVVGSDAGGATRWVQIGPLRFQPSEIAKIFLILFFANFIQKNNEKLNTMKIFFMIIIFAAVPLALIKEQPALSTSIITAIVICGIWFVGGLSYKIVGGVLAVAIPTFVVSIILIVTKGSSFLKDYQYGRVMSWLQPEKFPMTARQQQNSIMAIGSGQLFGKGLNNTGAASVKSGNYIGEIHTDFIFSIAGEELGYVGCLIIIGLLILITIECMLIAKKSKELSGRLIATGMGTLIVAQSFVNIGVATGFLPNTGLPLPFVSYGLTSLWSLYIGIGLVLNIGLQPKKYGREVYR